MASADPGFTPYLAVLKASYDYEPQSDDEVALKEDQLLFLLERTDEDWWKVKVKLESQDDDGPVGLVPAAYVEEAPHTSLVKALYDYDAAADGELSIKEDDVLRMYETEGDWILAQHDSADGAGYVPANYVEEASGPTPSVPIPAAPAIVVPDSPPQPSRPSLSNYEDPAVRVQSHKLTADDIKTWSVSELDKKGKKKKGTLGIGNGSLFFASESDKAAVQKWQTSDVVNASIDKPKHVLIEIGGPTPTSLHFHAGSKDNAEEILDKVNSSKAIATGGSTSRSEPAKPPLANKPSVHFSEESPVIIPPESHTEEEEEYDGEFAVALYAFKADGEDELTIAEGEQLLVLERDGDEWWKCRNAHGVEGVVPAQYIELQTGASASAAASSQPEDDGDPEAEAEAEAEAERQRQAREAAERAEALKKKREAEERKKRQLEEERAKAERDRERREKAAKAAARPDSSNGPSSPPPAKPSEELKRPPPDQTRTWHDRSGQFKVDAAFLGFSNGKLRLHKVNGVTVEVPADKMSIEDMKYVERLMSKGRKGSRADDEDVPLAITARVNASSSGSNGRAPPPPKKAPQIDWFDFFLSAGCDVDDCTRYATAFERDKIDETILPDVTDSTMRSLGLKEGDIIRVKKAIEKRKPTDNLNKPSPYIQDQIRRDEELAKQLQAAESSGRPAPNLFTTGVGGALKPRRGRPTAKGSLPLSTVDIKAIDNASDNIQRTSSPQSAQPSSGNAVQPPPRSSSALAAPTSGFDDNFGSDPWANRPSSTKPAATSPTAQAPRAPSAPPAAPQPEVAAPPAPAPPPAPPAPPAPAPAPQAAPATSGAPSLAKTTESDIFDQLARLSKLRETSSPVQQLQPQHTVSPPPMSTTPSLQTPNFQRGMGVNNSPLPMGSFQSHTPTPPQPYNGPRGPFAPVPANQGLLQPLIPTQTGFNSFVPTRPPTQATVPPVPQMQGLSLSPPPMMLPQQTGMPMMAQPTGMQMMSQPTGMPMNGNGFGGGLAMSPFGSGSAFTGQTMQPLQPQFTSFNPNAGSQFNTLAAPPLPPMPQQQSAPKDSPANIFASMKSGTFEDDSQTNNGPRPADMYDALRPNPVQMQPTGWGQTYGMGYQR